MDAGLSYALEKVSTHLDYPLVYLFISLSHPPPSFTGFQQNLPPQGPNFEDKWKGAPVRRSLTRCCQDTSALFGPVSHRRQPSSSIACHKNLLTENEEQRKKIRSEQCVGSKVTFLSVYLISKNRAARVIISLGCGQLRLKVSYFFSFLNFMLFPSTTHKLWIFFFLSSG